MDKQMKIVYSKDSLKYLAKIDRSVAEHIRKAINGLTLTPAVGDIKVLQGYDDGRMRLRIGKYRVIFKYEKGEVEILFIMSIGPRGDIYK